MSSSSRKNLPIFGFTEEYPSPFTGSRIPRWAGTPKTSMPKLVKTWCPHPSAREPLKRRVHRGVNKFIRMDFPAPFTGCKIPKHPGTSFPKPVKLRVGFFKFRSPPSSGQRRLPTDSWKELANNPGHPAVLLNTATNRRNNPIIIPTQPGSVARIIATINATSSVMKTATEARISTSENPVSSPTIEKAIRLLELHQERSLLVYPYYKWLKSTDLRLSEEVLISDLPDLLFRIRPEPDPKYFTKPTLLRLLRYRNRSRTQELVENLSGIVKAQLRENLTIHLRGNVQVRLLNYHSIEHVAKSSATSAVNQRR